MARDFLAEIVAADGVIISTPACHGSLPGPLKNPIVCAHGWQGTGTALAGLRGIVHSLRGWPTPLGVAINSSLSVFDESGEVSDPEVAMRLRVLAEQVTRFGRSTEVAA